MSDPEYAKVTVIIETSESVETMVFPKARDIYVGRHESVERGMDVNPFRVALRPSGVMDLDIKLTAEVDVESDHIYFGSRKITGQNSAH